MGPVQERAIETVILLRHVHWVRPYGSAVWNASPCGSALASGHRTASHGRVRHNCWAQSDLGRRGSSSDLDAGDAALGNGCSDGHCVLAESDQGKDAGGHTLDGLLHVLAEMVYLRLRLDLPLGKLLVPGWQRLQEEVELAPD